MAQIVLGLGSSHGPLMTPPDKWDDLVTKDIEDPRLGYDALLAGAPAWIEMEITPEKKQARYDA